MDDAGSDSLSAATPATPTQEPTAATAPTSTRFAVNVSSPAGSFVAEPPDWSVLRDPPGSSSRPQQLPYTPQRTSSSQESLFVAPFAAYENSPRGGASVATSFSGSSAGHSAPVPPYLAPSLQQPVQLSLSRSCDTGGADASVLLGLEELERQQADLEKRRAHEAAR